MVRSIFIVAVLLLTTFKLEAKKIKGQILYKNDTVDVVMKIPIKFLAHEPDYKKIQYEIVYYDSSGAKQKLNPDEATEVRFVYSDQVIRMVSKKNTLRFGVENPRCTNIFLRMQVDGNLKLYNYFYTKVRTMHYDNLNTMNSTSSSYTVSKLILQKGDGELAVPKWLTFKKDMLQYLQDCPELTEKIEKGEFRKSDLELIVEFYNENCG